MLVGTISGHYEKAYNKKSSHCISVCVCLCVCVCVRERVWVRVAQSCPTLCDPMVWSLTGSSVHVIFQARILEWVVISFSGRSSRPRNQTWVSHIACRLFTIWAIREALNLNLLPTSSLSLSVLHSSEQDIYTPISWFLVLDIAIMVGENSSSLNTQQNNILRLHFLFHIMCVYSGIVYQHFLPKLAR